MKKLMPLFLFFSFFFTNAQIEFKPGLKSGLNIASITNSNGDSKTDFYVGAFVTVHFVDFYNLQPEVIYSRQGDKFSSDSFDMDYLSVAIANKFFPSKDLGLHVIIGPSFDFKVSDNFDSDYGENLMGFDFALFGGVGYEFPFGLSIEARYKQGFVDIWGENYNDTVTFDDLAANKVVQIGLTYQFDI